MTTIAECQHDQAPMTSQMRVACLGPSRTACAYFTAIFALSGCKDGASSVSPECIAYGLLVEKVARMGGGSRNMRSMPVFIGKGDVENVRDPEADVLKWLRR